MSSDVTRILSAAKAGDPMAAAELLPLVYNELRKLATARMAAESTDHTLQPTALVHEAYLRLVGPAEKDQWVNRSHFFAAAAEAMRRILIENARKKKSAKGGGDHRRLPLDEVDQPVYSRPIELLDLDDALTELERQDRTTADLVKLRFFAGMTLREAAVALHLAPRTADAMWAYARAWLLDALGDGPADGAKDST